jgi:hypothetical protein
MFAICPTHHTLFLFNHLIALPREYCHVMGLLYNTSRFGLAIVCIETSQIVTTNEDYVLTVLHTSYLYRTHYLFLVCCVFTSRCLVAASNSGFTNYPLTSATEF